MKEKIENRLKELYQEYIKLTDSDRVWINETNGLTLRERKEKCKFLIEELESLIKVPDKNEELKKSIKTVLDAGMIVSIWNGYQLNITNGPPHGSNEYALRGVATDYCYEDDGSLDEAIEFLIENKDKE